MENKPDMNLLDVVRGKVLSRIQLPTNIVMGGNHRTNLFQHYQTPKEIVEFLDVVYSMPEDRRQVALEIGLYNGGTHLLWKQYYSKVVSIEVELERCIAVYNSIPDSKNSWFIVGDSTNQQTIEQTKIVTGLVDLLFIDACHSLVACQSDWYSFEPIVKSGGIVAFHDIECKIDGYGVRDFVTLMRNGGVANFDPKTKINEIYYGNEQGIGWYVKP